MCSNAASDMLLEEKHEYPNKQDKQDKQEKDLVPFKERTTLERNTLERTTPDTLLEVELAHSIKYALMTENWKERIDTLIQIMTRWNAKNQADKNVLPQVQRLLDVAYSTLALSREITPEVSLAKDAPTTFANRRLKIRVRSWVEDVVCSLDGELGDELFRCMDGERRAKRRKLEPKEKKVKWSNSGSNNGSSDNNSGSSSSGSNSGSNASSNSNSNSGSHSNSRVPLVVEKVSYTHSVSQKKNIATFKMHLQLHTKEPDVPCIEVKQVMLGVRDHDQDTLWFQMGDTSSDNKVTKTFHWKGKLEKLAQSCCYMVVFWQDAGRLPFVWKINPKFKNITLSERNCPLWQLQHPDSWDRKNASELKEYEKLAQEAGLISSSGLRKFHQGKKELWDEAVANFVGSNIMVMVT